MGEIIRLDEGDAEEVHEVLRVTWADTYNGILSDAVINAASSVWHSAETLRRQMKNRDILFAGYLEEGKLRGIARAAKAEGDTVKVFQLYVLPSDQRRGIGSQLMRYVQGWFPDARKFTISVAPANQKGVSFYRKLGFRFVGETILNVGVGEIRELEGVLEL